MKTFLTKFKVFLVFILFSKFDTIFCKLPPKCTSPTTIRREIRSLNPNEVQRIKNVMTQMHNAGWFDWFSHVHFAHSVLTHGTPLFLPWHRYFVRQFEVVGRTYDSWFFVPYWDALTDAASPASSVVFREDYWGGNGSGMQMCIGSGFERGWQREYPNRGCISRKFDNGNTIRPWFLPEIESVDLGSSKNYTAISVNIQRGIHGAVHNGIGGDMSTMYSPNDSIFFLLHGFVDYLWWKWQSGSPSRLTDYGGVVNGTQQLLTDVMPGFNVPVNDVMVLGYGSMCYSYNNRYFLIDRDRKDRRLSSTPSNRNKSQSNNQNTLYHNQSVSKRQQNDTAVQEDIQKVTQVPTMSLVSLLNATMLNRFFPGIVDGEFNANMIHMPNVVTPKAVEYATEYLNNPDKQFKADVTPVSSSSITDSIVATAQDNCLNCTGKGISNQRRPRQSKQMGRTREFIAPPTPRDLKMPVPASLPDSYLRMMNMDINEYSKYYKSRVQLIEYLNSVGYVSPYIQ
ncbi:hypothetical protein BB560_003165 [Smittium megazygosporum]|uniref:Tyrosinase copper-binding domain-containing protein n=1 Tax=Smittium megazygosporum TaxID=133381 RepID=A0A2T9ZCQ6_9FUNG|nr:hypothetical protein BB560_003165 [Smittium megazygosporum]